MVEQVSRRVTRAGRYGPCSLCQPRPPGHSGPLSNSGKPYSRLSRGSEEINARQIGFLCNSPRFPLARTRLVPRMYLALSAFLHSAFCILPSPRGGFDVALMSHWGGLPSPPTAFLLSAFYFLLSPRGVFARPFDVGSWLLDVGCSVFTISIPNTTPLPRLSRGGLGALWHHPGTFLYP